MAATTLQFRRAMRIYASDTIDIPHINNLYVTGTSNATAPSTNKLYATTTFQTIGVKPGDIVYNMSTGSTPTGVATVTAVNSQTELTLSANIFTTTAQAYRIFRAVQNGGDINNGCILYYGTSTLPNNGQLRVLTLGGDDLVIPISFNNALLPLQVIRLYENGTTSESRGWCTAMW